MAISADFARVGFTARPLSDTAVESSGEAVLIVDARSAQLPVVLANATARRCLLGGEAGSLVDCSLHTWLGAAADAAIGAALQPIATGKPVLNRVLAWRLPGGETSIFTEFKLLAAAPAQRLVMLTFSAAAAETSASLRQHRRLWIRSIGPVETQVARPFRAVGPVQNIRALKTAPIDLKNMTGWLNLSMNMAKMHAWRWDRASDSLDFAGLDGQMRHLPRVFPGMKNLMARMHPRDRLAARRAIDQAFATHTEVHEEFRLRSKSGRYRCYAAVARPLFDAARQPSGLVGVTQDVTARHESQARLRQSEELLRTTTANSADTLMLVDTDLCVRFINRGEFGMRIEQIVGRSVEVLLSEWSREGIIAKLRQVLATAQPVTYEFDVKVAGAEPQYLENRAVLVSDDGIGTGISITVRNITERKRLEREILDVSSRERQSIGRDLHDGLGQELTGVALMLRGLATRLQKHDPECVAQVDEIVALVNQSIETARSLARGLLPVSTDNGGLPLALRNLAGRSRDLYKFQVKFRSEVTCDEPLSETSASHLYRIAQEALTNAARHGHATAVDVFLRVSKLNFLLEIVDNGIGTIDSGRSSGGMGLKIMKYRASMIGASFEILPNRPRGTVIRVSGEKAPLTPSLQSANSI